MSDKHNPSKQKPSNPQSRELRSFEPWETPRAVSQNRVNAREGMRKKLEELQSEKKSDINETKE